MRRTDCGGKLTPPAARVVAVDDLVGGSPSSERSTAHLVADGLAVLTSARVRGRRTLVEN